MDWNHDRPLDFDTLDGQLGTPRDFVNWLNAQSGYSPKAGDADVVYLTPEVVITSDGGLATKLINKTGAASIKGTVVKHGTSVDRSVVLTGADELEAIGIMYSDGVEDGEFVWVTKALDALVKLENNVGATRGNWLRTSITAAGRADGTNADAPGLVLTHFYEIGHVGQTVSGDPAGALVRATIHFN